MSFTIRHHNRHELPVKHVIVCEDNLANQAAIAAHFSKIFPSEGPVQVSYVPGALMCATLLEHTEVDLIILDHDMPHGNGTDLIGWFKSHFAQMGRPLPNLITFSGIPANNDHMKNLHPEAHLFVKGAVIMGDADSLIKRILNVS